MLKRVAVTSVALLIINVVVAATGYLRELVLARTFGAGTETDAFYFSLALIQTAHDLLFGATLTATIVPLLHRRKDEAYNHDDPARFVVTAALTVVLLASALAIIVRSALPYLMDVLAPSMSVDVRAQCIVLVTILVWLLPLNALTNVGVLVLNAHHRFLLAAMVYFLVNIIFIAVLLLLAPVIGASSLAIASLAGPLVVLPILAISLARIGLLRATWPDFSKKFFAPAWRLARPILLTLGIGSSIGLLMLAHLIIRGFAADRGEGSVAALGYAFRLYELPLSLIANPAAVLMLPNIAVLYKAGHMADIGEIVRQTLLAGLVVLFPAAIVTWAGADLIVYVLLEHGNFGHPAAILTADALRGFAPAIIGEGILVVFYRVFYAMHRPSPAVIISAAALASLILFLVLARNKAFIAIPLSLSGGFLVGATILMGFLVREIGPSTIPNLPSVLRWGVCALAGLATWRITGAFQAHTIWAEIRPLIYFLLVYSTGILMLFADYRRTLLRILTSLRSPTS